MVKVIDRAFLDALWCQASESPRLRMNFDMRNSAADTSQRMLNALQPGTVVPIHRHENTDETVICLCGRLEEIIYEEVIEYERVLTSGGEDAVRKYSFKELSRQLLCPADGIYGMQIPSGTWHSINVIEPSVIFEAKDGKYEGG